MTPLEIILIVAGSVAYVAGAGVFFAMTERADPSVRSDEFTRAFAVMGAMIWPAMLGGLVAFAPVRFLFEKTRKATHRIAEARSTHPATATPGEPSLPTATAREVER